MSDLNLKTEVENDDKITVSTVKLEIPHGPNHNQHYETCLFWDGGSYVTDRYQTEQAAREGHETQVEAISNGNYELQEAQFTSVEFTDSGVLE